MTDRRAFIRGVAGAVGALASIGAVGRAQDPAGGDSTLQAERLRDPSIIGRPRDAVSSLDNDPVVVGIERRLKCTCGCTLDVYTCRTTDFTCTFSPALHREIIDKVRAGETPEQIVAAFVAREGEAILMAPPAEGFNIAGYLVPGLVMASGALVLAAYLASRRRAVEATVAASPVASDGTAGPPPPDEAQLERLRRALDDVEA